MPGFELGDAGGFGGEFLLRQVLGDVGRGGGLAGLRGRRGGVGGLAVVKGADVAEGGLLGWSGGGDGVVVVVGTGCGRLLEGGWGLVSLWSWVG